MASSNLSRGFKTVYGLLFFLMFFYIFNNIDSDKLFAPDKFLLVIDYLIAILEMAVSTMGTIAVSTAMAVATAISRFGFRIPLTNIRIGFNSAIADDNTANTITANNYVTYLIQSIFPNSNLVSSTTSSDPIVDFLEVWGVAIAYVLLPVILLSAIGFMVRGESRLAITSFLALQILIILAMYIPNADSETGRMLLITLTLPAFEGTSSSLGSDLLLLVNSRIFQLGLGLYLLLEIAFQAAYAISVVDPMIDRERRIKEHLKRIDNFKPQPDKEKKSVTLGKETSKKYDLVAASYLREMVERKVFRRGEDVQDQKTTMRLQSYLASLRRTDRKFESKITAISAQPSTMAILKNTIPLIAMRVVAVVVLAFIILNPGFLLEALFSDPVEGTSGIINFPQLAESVELEQPEFRTVILFNIMLLIIVLAAVLHWILVHKPEVPERRIKKVDTIVDFQEIKDVSEISEDISEA
ncbi:MAG: hypothetical protein ACXAC7_01630 [Candidatus Hodarchaeales archaeon]|jgi:hypothetical protein